MRLIAHIHPNPTFWGDGLGRSNWWSICHNNLGISSRDVVGIASQGCVGTKHVTRVQYRRGRMDSEDTCQSL